MSLLIFILIVVVVMALAMWAIYYLPMPPGSPVWIKNFLYVVLLIVAIIVILAKSGVVNAQQVKPVPQLKPSKPVAAGPITPGKQVRAAPSWQGFAGARRCEQIGKMITCDNGYKQVVR
jgi:hypothetical protein